MKRFLWLLLSLIILFSYTAFAQKKPVKKTTPPKKTQVQKPPVKSKPDPVADDKKVRDIIAFFEYMLNTLGSQNTSSRDKEVLVTQSYTKIFRDKKVQVEDDLDKERHAITNKDVVAYLKDVDFFFSDVKFELLIEDVKTNTLPDGSLFYKVSTRRSMTGTSSEGEKITNTTPRYIEINYNPDNQDLKIVSIYTNQLNEKQELTNWWKELSYEWQAIFKRNLNLQDSVEFRHIKNISAIEKLDLSNNKYIRDIEALAQLKNLRLLDLSGTEVSDISPIRNLTELVDLNLSGTDVQDLTPLRYSIKLQSLSINNTPVQDIFILERMASLKTFNAAKTGVSDFSAVANLTTLEKLDASYAKLNGLTSFATLINLQELNVSGCSCSNASDLRNLKSLQELDLDSTSITNLQDFAGLENLRVLHINHTRVADLGPLKNLPHLQKIYCDQSLIQKKDALSFMTARPNTLVVFDSKDLQGWWETLSPAWQTIFSKAAKINGMPSKEDLARLPLVDSVNLNKSNSINTIEPLSKLPELRVIIAAQSGVSDLSPLKNHHSLEYIDVSGSPVQDLTPLIPLKKLRVLRADKSKVQNIESLEFMSLQKLYVDETSIDDKQASEFLSRNPTCLIMYKTGQLKNWWLSLTDIWKRPLQAQLKEKIESRESLHALIEQESLTIKDASIANLNPLKEFIRLRELHFSGTNISSIPAFEKLRTLKSLQASNSPIQKVDSVHLFTELEELDISNTPIEDIYPLWKLKNLKSLNCAGTQIKRLDALEKLEKLEFFDCSNTNVSRLNSLDYLPLKTLKCFNTKVSTRSIENFASSHPDCQVIYYR